VSGYRLGPALRVTKAEEMTLWMKYAKWRRARRIPQLRAVARATAPAADVLASCDLKGALVRVLQDVARARDLIASLRLYVGPDELVVEANGSSGDGARIPGALRRVLRDYEVRRRRLIRGHNFEPCRLQDLFDSTLRGMLNDILGGGEPAALQTIAGATNREVGAVAAELYNLAIDLELLPPNLLNLIPGEVPVSALPVFVEQAEAGAVRGESEAIVAAEV